MIGRFTSYFTKLERLSSDELVRSAEKLVLAENTSIAKLPAIMPISPRWRLGKPRSSLVTKACTTTA